MKKSIPPNHCFNRDGVVAKMKVVIDTNILVSAFYSTDGTPARLLSLVISGQLTLCFDSRILVEYRDVLLRPRFGFEHSDVESLLVFFEQIGFSVVAPPIQQEFIDEDDKKFYEVAVFCDAKLVTGNLKHFPKEKFILSPTEFMRDISKHSQ